MGGKGAMLVVISPPGTHARTHGGRSPGESAAIIVRARYRVEVGLAEQKIY